MLVARPPKFRPDSARTRRKAASRAGCLRLPGLTPTRHRKPQRRVKLLRIDRAGDPAVFQLRHHPIQQRTRFTVRRVRVNVARQIVLRDLGIAVRQRGSTEQQMQRWKIVHPIDQGLGQLAGALEGSGPKRKQRLEVTELWIVIRQPRMGQGRGGICQIVLID